MTYDTFGNECETCSSGTRFEFAGAYGDLTGLIYLVHRYYDPNTEQFLSVDPLISATHAPYSYASQDPVNSIDPSGEWEFYRNSKTANILA
jgi:RHS repeat-associated protein